MNHVCLGEVFKDLFPEFDSTCFHRTRKIRNGINYYGEKVDLIEGEKILMSALTLRKQVREMAKKF